MNSKKYLFSILIVLFFNKIIIAQTTKQIKSISEYEQEIIKNYRNDSIKYLNKKGFFLRSEDELNLLTIRWKDEIIKSYKYSNEVFDKLGYKLEAMEGSVRIFLNCNKFIRVLVIENTKDLSIDITMEKNKEYCK